VGVELVEAFGGNPQLVDARTPDPVHVELGYERSVDVESKDMANAAGRCILRVPAAIFLAYSSLSTG